MPINISSYTTLFCMLATSFLEGKICQHPFYDKCGSYERGVVKAFRHLALVNRYNRSDTNWRISVGLAPVSKGNGKSSILDILEKRRRFCY